MNKQLATKFYDLVDSGIHPLTAFDILYIAHDFNSTEYYELYQIADRLAKDVVNYPPEVEAWIAQ